MFRNYYINNCLSVTEMTVINMLDFRSYNLHSKLCLSVSHKLVSDERKVSRLAQAHSINILCYSVLDFTAQFPTVLMCMYTYNMDRCKEVLYTN